MRRAAGVHLASIVRFGPSYGKLLDPPAARSGNFGRIGAHHPNK